MTGEFAAAVHALVYLNHKKRTLSSEELAQNVCTNPARIRRIMAKLKKAGLVRTKEGADGGYEFQADPEKVDLRMICEAFEIDVVAAAWSPGNEDMDCLVASGMAGIMNGIYGELDQMCKERLAQITVASIDRKIFGT